jgi:hypothetical protein
MNDDDDMTTSSMSTSVNLEWPVPPELGGGFEEE